MASDTCAPASWRVLGKARSCSLDSVAIGDGIRRSASSHPRRLEDPEIAATMCPLRYILLLLSLLVAMIGLSQAMSAQEVAMLEDDDETSKQGGKAHKQSSFRTLVDMLNGKYLYDAWKASRAIKAE